MSDRFGFDAAGRAIAGLLVVALIFGARVAHAGDTAEVTHGLMWHRSGLPAVFPLQVKTLGPQDYYVTLSRVDTDEVVLAAYIEGGRFFQVLVPPGTFRVRFAAGNVWQGEGALFGPGDKTWRFEVENPLTFAVRNFNTKGGHIVDLTDVAPGVEAGLKSRELVVCQGLRLVWAAEREPRGPEVLRSQRTGVPRFRNAPRADARVAGALEDFAIEDVAAKTLSDRDGRPVSRKYPRYEVRVRPCGTQGQP